MICVLFRFLHDDGSDPDYYGMAAAESVNDLYWKIDEHGDPNSCEIIKVLGASICFEVNKEYLNGEDVDCDESFSNIEISDTFFNGLCSDKFVRPNWEANIL
jgi:hypothetical protein